MLHKKKINEKLDADLRKIGNNKREKETKQCYHKEKGMCSLFKEFSYSISYRNIVHKEREREREREARMNERTNEKGIFQTKICVFMYD